MKDMWVGDCILCLFVRDRIMYAYVKSKASAVLFLSDIYFVFFLSVYRRLSCSDIKPGSLSLTPTLFFYYGISANSKESSDWTDAAVVLAAHRNTDTGF
jgi:hypothetical protein